MSQLAAIGGQRRDGLVRPALRRGRPGPETAALACREELGLPVSSEEAGLVGGPVRPGEPWITLDGSRNFRPVGRRTPPPSG